MTVSNEDLEAAIDAAFDAADEAHDKIHRPYMGCCGVVGMKAAVHALVSHGWGPRPCVSQSRLAQLAETAAELSPVPLLDYLRECGIEVTEGG